MGRVWAITRLTMAEALRTRLAIAFFLLLVGMMALLITTATGDGTVSGKVQMFLSYSIGITHLLLALLVALLACRTVDQDIKTQRIDNLVSKPVARWQFLLGRWLGIVLMGTVLLTGAMILTYVMVVVFAGQAEPASDDQFRLQDQVLVARRSVKPLPPKDLDEQVARRFEEFKMSGRLIEGYKRSEVEKGIRNDLLRRNRSVPAGMRRGWQIANVGPVKEGDVTITVRFKFEPSITTSGMPRAGLHGDTIFGHWVFGQWTSKKRYVTRPMEQLYREAHEISVPSYVVASNGTLEVWFINLDPRGVTATFPMADGLEVLVSQGTFGSNFVRSVLAVLATIVFITSVAVACSTFLSFPIAALVTISILVVGLSGGFMADAIDMSYDLDGASIFERLEKGVAWLAITLIPTVSVGEFTDDLIDGRLIEWSAVLWQVLKLAVINSAVLAIFAVFVFNRRELGKVIV